MTNVCTLGSLGKFCLVVTLSTTWCVAPTWGFESVEHRTVSEHAMSLASAFTSTLDARASVAATLEKFSRGCSGLTGPMTYAEFVVAVDMTASPIREVLLRGSGKPLPEKCEDLDSEAITAFTRLATQWAAAHSNADHFQDALLRNFAWWHRMALLIAAKEQNLFAALLVNAFADHFIQDFFAPGHIATPRDLYHDLPSVAMHDHYNEIGAWFVMNQRTWPQLEELARTADPARSVAVAVRCSAGRMSLKARRALNCSATIASMRIPCRGY
jgi:hypothetical protein